MIVGADGGALGLASTRRVDERARFRREFAVVAGVAALFGVWVGIDFGGERVSLYVDDLATVAAALTAAWLCVGAARRRSGRPAAFWWLFAAASAAWTVGEGIWALYDLALGGVPAVSWADVAYLAALPPVAAALLIHPALHGRPCGKIRSLLDGLTLAAALFLISWLIVFEPVRHSTDLTTLEGAVTLAYPLGDVVIVFLVVLLVRGTTRAYRLNLWCLLAGLLALSFSDAVYSYLANVKHFSSGGLIDTGWFVGYLAIALSARFSLTQSAAARRSQATPALTNAAVLVPFLPMLAALTLAAIMIQLGHHLDRVTLITAFTLVGCVLARQALLMLDFAARRRVQNNPTDPLATDQPADTLSAATAA